MKVIAEQLEFGLREATEEEKREAALQALWARREKEEAAKHTPEACCLRWLGGDQDWWNALAEYERANWLERYKWEREKALIHRVPIATPGYVLAQLEESWTQSQTLARAWSIEIRKAFLERQPCPIKPSFEFEHVLAMAFQMASIPRECLQAAE